MLETREQTCPSQLCSIDKSNIIDMHEMKEKKITHRNTHQKDARTSHSKLVLCGVNYGIVLCQWGSKVAGDLICRLTVDVRRSEVAHTYRLTLHNWIAGSLSKVR